MGQLDRETVIRCAKEAGFSISQETVIPGSAETLLAIPEGLDEDVAGVVAARWGESLYAHQAKGIAAALGGHDLTLATPTASGKTLVFMACAAHYLKKVPAARVLALYPARALILDQLGKWESFLSPLSLSVGYIYGGVPMEERERILTRDVVLMTPDVAHAWLMRRLELPVIRGFLGGLRLLILDETHEYQGVFGTNMGYLLRRLEVASRAHQVICSTATIGAPGEFVEKLSGRSCVVVGREDDGSPRPAKTVLLAKNERDSAFEGILGLLRSLAVAERHHFLAFADSRKMVERVAAGVHRGSVASEGAAETSEDDDDPAAVELLEVQGVAGSRRVLPYRAGYEETDRAAIQKALEGGELAGVVSTSALELGLDVGNIDLVVLLSKPPSVKSFWQRIGRAGRQNAGICLFIDDKDVVANVPGGLEAYLARSLEPNWLYLENRMIQYCNVLCAARELAQLGHVNRRPFDSLPGTFVKMLENELHPTEAIPQDLYPLKQRAESSPHIEFPLRAGVEPSFKIVDIHGLSLGQVTLGQALREAYPGALYYYMARPYRVLRVDHRHGEITCKRDRQRSTEPIRQVMVFPRFEGGVLQLWEGEGAFVGEVDLQVSERVQGFWEKRGSKTEEHRYGVGSPYSQRDLNRFFPTTGVCWHYPEMALRPEIGSYVLEAFSTEFGVQTTDLGVGIFLAKSGAPSQGGRECRGLCVYDAVQGSLRLTERLASHFPDVVNAALALAGRSEQDNLSNVLEELSRRVHSLVPADRYVDPSEDRISDEWYPVVRKGEKAMYVTGATSQEVIVVDYRFTPQGLMYELEAAANLLRMVKWDCIQPLHGVTKMVRYNAMTGEIVAPE